MNAPTLTYHNYFNRNRDFNFIFETNVNFLHNYTNNKGDQTSNKVCNIGLPDVTKYVNKGLKNKMNES